MTDYPNREHRQADGAASRRALRALDEIENEVRVLRRRVEAGIADEDDTNILADRARQLTGHLGVLRALREVREWHALDMDAAAAEDRKVEEGEEIRRQIRNLAAIGELEQS